MQLLIITLDTVLFFSYHQTVFSQPYNMQCAMSKPPTKEGTRSLIEAISTPLSPNEARELEEMEASLFVPRWRDTLSSIKDTGEVS
jgi:hypothetical protein